MNVISDKHLKWYETLRKKLKTPNVSMAQEIDMIVKNKRKGTYQSVKVIRIDDQWGVVVGLKVQEFRTPCFKSAKQAWFNHNKGILAKIQLPY